MALALQSKFYRYAAIGTLAMMLVPRGIRSGAFY
nr:MAG TPA: hypothetical protein [Caudoviricetes sp.]